MDALARRRTGSTFSRHNEDALNAFIAGADMLYRPADLDAAFKAIKNAVKDGTITEKRLNESVLRILAVKTQFGIIK